MEHETTKGQSAELDLEEGEISDSDDGYTPLPRPDIAKNEFSTASAARTRAMNSLSDQDDDLNEDYKTDSDGSTDDSSSREVGSAFPKRMRTNQDKRLRMKTKPELKAVLHQQSPKTMRPNKYNIWTESLQEDTLMETMRGCDVTSNGLRSRDVESYDYTLKSRLQSGNAFNRLKRRQSNSDDSDGFGGGKRMRTAPYAGLNSGTGRRPVKERLAKRNSSDSNSNDSSQNAPRHILDLNINDDSDLESIAKELAHKLCEEKDELMLRIVKVLGKDIPIKLFQETQKIEADGGMLIMNGARRRTPGGVFLFLLKHNEAVRQEDKKQIFCEERKTANKERKNIQAANREKKVEELKKTLNLKANEKEIPTIPIMSHLKAETHSTLSNPPPSPVGDENRESSPDFEARNIHLNVTSPEKGAQSSEEKEPEVSAKSRSVGQAPELQSYDDDFLDMTCDDMDLF